jgi:glycosyltransferase involved in cell wall biosynthesis
VREDGSARANRVEDDAAGATAERPRRIALLCNDFWPTVGGVQTAVHGLAHALGRRGHEVVVLTRQPGGAPAAELVGDVPVRRFEWNLRPRMSFPLRAARARREVRRAITRFAPDLIYVHFVTVHALYAWDCSVLTGAPFLLSFRGNDVIRIAPRSIATRTAYRLLTRAAAANLFCSPWLQGAAVGQSWFRGNLQRTGVLADAVEVGHRSGHRPLERPYVLAGGRMVHKKGFDILLDAWARVGARVTAPLLLAGEGEERAALERRARDLGLGERVRFTGAIPHAELLALLEGASLCVVPSRDEPYGITVVEAQALGVPVVASNVGNLPTLIEDRVTGYLATPTTDGMASTLLAAWEDPHRQAIGEAARRSPGASRTYVTMADELEGWAERAQAMT